MECNGQNFLWFGLFFTLLTPPNNPKNQNFENMKKTPEHIIIDTGVLKMTIIWCMVPEIPNTMYRIFCHLGPFFTLLPP